MKRLCFAIIAIAICLFPNTNINAQRITFSSELGYFITDDNISAISQIWEGYINAIDTGSDCSHFWIEGSCDIHIDLHKDGLLNTYNIRKLTDEIYEINTIAYYPDCAIKGGLINSIYKVCAIKIGDGWHLFSLADHETIIIYEVGILSLNVNSVLADYCNATIILQTIDLGLFKAISYIFSRYW